MDRILVLKGVSTRIDVDYDVAEAVKTHGGVVICEAHYQPADRVAYFRCYIGLRTTDLVAANSFMKRDFGANVCMFDRRLHVYETELTTKSQLAELIAKILDADFPFAIVGA